jgi:hypothetical protein
VVDSSITILDKGKKSGYKFLSIGDDTYLSDIDRSNMIAIMGSTAEEKNPVTLQLGTNTKNRIFGRSDGKIGVNTHMEVAGSVKASKFIFPDGTSFVTAWQKPGSEFLWVSDSVKDATTNLVKKYIKYVGNQQITGTLKLGNASLYLKGYKDAIENTNEIFANDGPLLINSNSSQNSTNTPNTIINANGGKVGIGTVSISSNAKLDVAGNVNATGYLLNGSPLPTTQWTTNSDNSISYGNGNVAIGNPSSSSQIKLEVNGIIKANQLQITDQAGNGKILVSDVNGNAIWTDNVFRLTTNAGIGKVLTSDADGKGVWKDNVWKPSTKQVAINYSCVDTYYNNNDGTSSTSKYTLNYDGSYTDSDQDFNSWYREVVCTPNLQSVDNGISTDAINIGIGMTPSTSNKLQINGDLGLEGSSKLKLGNNTGEYIYSNRNSGDIRFASGFQDRMVLTNGGRIGIGTNSPSAKLEVVGYGGDNIDMIVNGRIKSSSNDGGLWAGNGFVGALDNGNKIGFWNQDWRLVVKNDGYVGVGTTNPAERLEVNGNIKANAIKFPDGSTLSSANALVGNEISKYKINLVESNGGDNTDPMVFYRVNNGYNNSELRLLLGDDLNTSEDKFTIGVNNSAANGAWNNFFSLNTKGELSVKKVIVTLDGWSDHVFGKSYQLQSLAEVEKYIQTNQHLPNIPSETELKEKGLDTGEMLKLQMAKIEELTLHLIEQQKQIANQQKELESLKAKLK